MCFRTSPCDYTCSPQPGTAPPVNTRSPSRSGWRSPPPVICSMSSPDSFLEGSAYLKTIPSHYCRCQIGYNHDDYDKSVNILLKFFITNFFVVAPGLFIDDDVNFTVPLVLGVNIEKFDFFSLALISSDFVLLILHCSLLVWIDRFLLWLFPPSSAKTGVLAMPDIRKHHMAAATALNITINAY